MSIDCLFCRIIAKKEPANIIEEYATTIIIEPLEPVTEGHVLVLPTVHVEDFTDQPIIMGVVAERASRYCSRNGIWPANVITSAGALATQTVMHMHMHIIPRRPNDGLHLPWTK